LVNAKRKRQYDDKISEIFDNRIKALKGLVLEYSLVKRNAKTETRKEHAGLAEGILRQLIQLYAVDKRNMIQINNLTEKFLDLQKEVHTLRREIKEKKSHDLVNTARQGFYGKETAETKTWLVLATPSSLS
jgi:hypothetical protein